MIRWKRRRYNPPRAECKIVDPHQVCPQRVLTTKFIFWASGSVFWAHAVCCCLLWWAAPVTSHLYGYLRQTCAALALQIGPVWHRGPHEHCKISDCFISGLCKLGMTPALLFEKTTKSYVPGQLPNALTELGHNKALQSIVIGKHRY